MRISLALSRWRSCLTIRMVDAFTIALVLQQDDWQLISMVDGHLDLGVVIE